MPNSSTRTLSLKQIAEDIRAGMHESALKEKYALSESDLQRVIRELVKRGVFTESEIRRRNLGAPLPSPATEPVEQPETWRCPACDAPQPQPLEECPVCGVVVSKFRHLQSRQNGGPIHPPDKRSPQQIRPDRPWLFLVISVVVCLLIGGLLVQWALYRGTSQRTKTTTTEAGGLKRFTSANFAVEVVEVSRRLPVLIEFYADWCGPCRRMEPVIDELAREMEGRAVIGKVRDDERDLFEKFRIQGIPAFFILRDGEIKEQFRGIQSKATLKNALERYSNSKGSSTVLGLHSSPRGFPKAACFLITMCYCLPPSREFVSVDIKGRFANLLQGVI